MVNAGTIIRKWRNSPNNSYNNLKKEAEKYSEPSKPVIVTPTIVNNSNHHHHSTNNSVILKDDNNKITSIPIKINKINKTNSVTLKNNIYHPLSYANYKKTTNKINPINKQLNKTIIENNLKKLKIKPNTNNIRAIKSTSIPKIAIDTLDHNPTTNKLTITKISPSDQKLMEKYKNNPIIIQPKSIDTSYISGTLDEFFPNNKNNDYWYAKKEWNPEKQEYEINKYKSIEKKRIPSGQELAKSFIKGYAGPLITTESLLTLGYKLIKNPKNKKEILKNIGNEISYLPKTLSNRPIQALTSIIGFNKGIKDIQYVNQLNKDLNQELIPIESLPQAKDLNKANNNENVNAVYSNKNSQQINQNSHQLIKVVDNKGNTIGYKKIGVWSNSKAKTNKNDIVEFHPFTTNRANDQVGEYVVPNKDPVAWALAIDKYGKKKKLEFSFIPKLNKDNPEISHIVTNPKLRIDPISNTKLLKNNIPTYEATHINPTINNIIKLTAKENKIPKKINIYLRNLPKNAYSQIRNAVRTGKTNSVVRSSDLIKINNKNLIKPSVAINKAESFGLLGNNKNIEINIIKSDGTILKSTYNPKEIFNSVVESTKLTSDILKNGRAETEATIQAPYNLIDKSYYTEIAGQHVNMNVYQALDKLMLDGYKVIKGKKIGEYLLQTPKKQSLALTDKNIKLALNNNNNIKTNLQIPKIKITKSDFNQMMKIPEFRNLYNQVTTQQIFPYSPSIIANNLNTYWKNKNKKNINTFSRNYENEQRNWINPISKLYKGYNPDDNNYNKTKRDNTNKKSITNTYTNRTPNRSTTNNRTYNYTPETNYNNNNKKDISNSYNEEEPSSKKKKDKTLDIAYKILFQEKNKIIQDQHNFKDIESANNFGNDVLINTKANAFKVFKNINPNGNSLRYIHKNNNGSHFIKKFNTTKEKTNKGNFDTMKFLRNMKNNKY